MTSWAKKHVRQKRRRKRSRRPALRITLGNISVMDVITTSMQTNCTEKRQNKHISKCEYVLPQRVHQEFVLLVCPDPREWAWQRNRWTTVGEEASWLQPEGTQWTPNLDLEHNNDSSPSTICLCCLTKEEEEKHRSTTPYWRSLNVCLKKITFAENWMQIVMARIFVPENKKAKLAALFSWSCTVSLISLIILPDVEQKRVNMWKNTEWTWL